MRAIVVGAGGGIGWATAQSLARQAGSQTLIVDRNAERREARLDVLRSAGAEAIGIGGDIQEPEFLASAVALAAAAFGGLDAVVNSAGVLGPSALLAALPAADFEKAFSVNVLPTLRLAQAAYPLLKESQGAFVAVSSTGARHPVPNFGGYAVSKAALTMLIRQLALEWGPDGIRVNCVAPGPAATPMAPAYADPEVRRARAATLPLRRIAEPAQVAETIVFLLSPAAAAVTGVELDVDCGMGLTTMQLSGASLGRLSTA